MITDVKSAVLPDVRRYWLDLQSLGVGKESALFRETSTITCEDSATERITVVDPETSKRERTSSKTMQLHHPGSNARLREMQYAESINAEYSLVADAFGLQLASVNTLHVPNLKHQVTGYEREVIFNHNGSLAWFGNLVIVVQRRIIATTKVVNRIISLEISFTPNPLLLHRGLKFEHCWDAERGHLDSLNIQLYFPRLLSEDDPLVTLLCEGATEDFIRLFRRGGYDVRNEIVSNSGNKSLIDVRQSL